MKLKRWLIILLLLVVANIAEAGRLYGKVVSSIDGAPIAGVTVFLAGTDYGMITDEDGAYEFEELAAGVYTLRTFYLGFHEILVKVQIGETDREQNIVLHPSLLALDEIVVTGTRTEQYLKDSPVTTQVITADKLNEYGAKDVSEVLNEVTGIVIENTQFGSMVSLQGYSKSHIMVLLDGMELVGRVNGQLDISQIPTSQIERIEIVKGASSALYGSDAMGGVINIITKAPGKDWKYFAELSYGENDWFNTDINLKGSLGPWKTSLDLGYRGYGGYTVITPSFWQHANSYDKYNGRIKLIKDYSDFVNVTTDIAYFNETQELTANDIFREITYNDRGSIRFHGDHKWLSGFNLNSSLEYSYFNHQFDKVVRKSGYVQKGDITNERNSKAEVNFEKDIKSNRINGGAQFEYEDIESDRVAGGLKSSNQISAYLQDEIEIGSRFVLLGGVRIDAHSEFGTEISPKISMMHSPIANFRLRFAYGYGFRAPSFKELYLDWQNTSVGLYVLGNPELDPERSKSFNLDAEYWSNSFYYLRLNYFYNRIDNLINYSFVRQDPEYAIWKSENIANAESRGVEFDLRIIPSKMFELALGYTYLDSWDNATDAPLVLNAKHKARINILYTAPFDIKTNLSLHYIGERLAWQEEGGVVVNDAYYTDPYWLLHANLSFPMIKNTRGFIGGRNLTDYNDEIWGPMPGREFYFGIKYSSSNN